MTYVLVFVAGAIVGIYAYALGAISSLRESHPKLDIAPAIARTRRPK